MRPSPLPASHSQSRRAILKMLVAVVVAFFICWAPFHAQRLMTAFVPDDAWTPQLLEIQSALFYVSGVLYSVSSTVNPILYNLMSKKYRLAFKETMCCCCIPPGQRKYFSTSFNSRRFHERSSSNVFSGGAGRTLLPKKLSVTRDTFRQPRNSQNNNSTNVDKRVAYNKLGLLGSISNRLLPNSQQRPVNGALERLQRNGSDS